MLVLTRRKGERIVFPSLNISVEISRVQGKTTLLGIEAPGGVKVIRGELADRLEEVFQSDQLSAQQIHELKNRISSVVLATHGLLKDSETNGVVDAELLSSTIEELHRLDEVLVRKQNKAASWNQEPAATNGTSNHKVAMIVEDNQNEATLLEAILRSSGFHVVTAIDGCAALSLLESNTVQPDILLLDMNLPKINGAEIVKQIRKNDDFYQLTIFAISGDSAEYTDVLIGSEGVNRWFQKPVHPEELVSQIEKDLAA